MPDGRELFEGAHIVKYVCPECGEHPNLFDGRWRWNGFAYEHHHGYTLGHVLALTEEQLKLPKEVEKIMENEIMPKPYDSREDTYRHIDRVRALLTDVINNLTDRGVVHDQSKLESPEKEIFDQVTPRLKGLTYGSDEYKAQLKEMGVALEHHYAKNSHHPEHTKDGIKDMSLLDLLEMIVDWKAATERHANGCMLESLRINKQRFGIDDQLWAVLYNTAVELKLLKEEPT